VEDVPLTYDFSGNLSDPDDMPINLSISSLSPYVTNISGFNITFLFPNGVTDAQVPLVLSDRFIKVVSDVHFIIQPVNDAPFHNIPSAQSATEDIPLTLNLTENVWDIDNETSDLFLVTDDPYASVNGLLITVTFPEGVMEHNVTLYVSDGINKTMAHIRFSITPVDDPPSIDPLGTFYATEDMVSVFDLDPFLHDVDTPIEALGIIVLDPRCSVKGRELHILIPSGGIQLTMEVTVADARTRVTAILTVNVMEVNDPPIVRGIPPKLFIEDEAMTMDLSVHIDDEDTPREELVLECLHECSIAIDGFNLTMLYNEPWPEHEVEISVFDSESRGWGNFTVQVQPVNDLPAVRRIGGLAPPVIIEVGEGSVGWFEVDVYDEDDNIFTFLIQSDWHNIDVLYNGTIVISPDHGEVGEYEATLRVEDMTGGSATVPIWVVVLNVNDPPTKPLITSPANHTVVLIGTELIFRVSVSDPDIAHGQVLTIVWSSNISGTIRESTTAEPLEFNTTLQVGVYAITVTIDDGEFSRQDWIEIEVEDYPIPPPPNGDDHSFMTTTTGIGLIIALILVAVLAISALVVFGHRDEEEHGRVPSEEVPVVVETPLVEEDQPASLAELSEDLGKMATQLETARATGWEWEEEEEEGGGTEEEPEAPAPTPEALAERAHAIEVREVMKVLTQLPRGLPTTLWGRDMGQLSQEIVDGERRTSPQGEPLVLIDGRWYIVDLDNVGTFLTEWKEEEEPLSPEEAKVKKLEQLEEALLEGRISESTYQELVRKYAGRD
jgi:hypothetical protein